LFFGKKKKTEKKRKKKKNEKKKNKTKKKKKTEPKTQTLFNSIKQVLGLLPGWRSFSGFTGFYRMPIFPTFKTATSIIFWYFRAINYPMTMITTIITT
jgi:hypothetical protein